MTLFARRSTFSAFLIALLLMLIGTAFLASIRLFVNPLVPATWQTPLSLLAVAIFAFSISPMRRGVNHFIERHFFLDELADQAALHTLSEALLQSSDLASVITACVTAIGSRLDLPFALCYLVHRDEHKQLTVKQVVPWQHPTTALPSLDGQSEVLEYLAKHGAPVSYLQLANSAVQLNMPENIKASLKEIMQTLQVELAVPLMGKDQLFAVYFLAPRRANRPFNADERTFIDVATAETITSIQRANYFEGDQQKTEFISIASHELRTPLTAIRGYLSMILDEHLTGDELDKHSHTLLQRIYGHTQDLVNMVNDILTLSRLESGRTKIEPQQVDIQEIIQKVVAKNQLAAAEKKITVKVLTKRNLPHAWADPAGVELILQNLVANAITYNHIGGQIELSTQVREAGTMLTFQVKDTGIGMSPEEIAHLYERFYRAATKETEGISGTGLGLNITQAYVQRMKGSITVKSQLKKGSVFSVSLPVFKPAMLEQHGNATASAEPEKNTPIGLMLLSPKRSGEAYTPADLTLLENISHQAIIAIQRAKLYEGDQMKTQFVSIASHELLTPISAIEGYITLVLKDSTKKMAPKTADFLGNVSLAIHRLSSLVRDLLSVSRLESGRMTITPEPFDIGKAVKEAITQLTFVAKEHQITLNLDPLAKALPLAWADPERTTQVLMNLTGNAIKYNKAGGSVTLSVSHNHAEPFLKVSVTDTGLGMDKEHMAHLFEKFYRVDSQETAGIVGTGLGLYITKSMVERMGGQMSVKSTLGKGSVFSFTLPVKRKAA